MNEKRWVVTPEKPKDYSYGLWDAKREMGDDAYIIPGKSGKFHDLERVSEATKDWDIPPYLIFLTGERSNGKTQTLNRLLMDAYNDGLKTIWTRNHEKTFKNPQFYRDFLNLGKNLGILPQEFTAFSEGVYDDEKGGDLICMFKSINLGSDLKGNEYRDVKYLLCDEFMVLPDESYPPGATTKLGGMLGTLRGYADACVLASNFTYVTNPYWASLNIYPKSNKGVTTFKETATVIEVCEKGYYNTAKFPASDPRAKAISRLQHGDDHSSYETDPNYELIATIPLKHAKRIEFDISTLNMTINFYQHGSGLVYASSGKKNPKHIQYVTYPKLLDQDSNLIPPYAINWLKELINTGSMRFFNANTLYETMMIIHKM